MCCSLNFVFANRFSFSIFFQFNFVGRILGPRGMTAKQLEQETGCKIMVRGKGSMRDKKKVHMSLKYSLYYQIANKNKMKEKQIFRSNARFEYGL